jgi:hypothetical protein
MLGLSKLPPRWLEGSWVERFSTAPDETNEGHVVYTTDAIDKPDLYCWICKNRFSQVTPKEFRSALRGSCRDQRPGYRASPLPAELRELLADRMAIIGRRLWACQKDSTPSPTSAVAGRANPGHAPPNDAQGHKVKREAPRAKIQVAAKRFHGPAPPPLSLSPKLLPPRPVGVNVHSGGRNASTMTAVYHGAPQLVSSTTAYSSPSWSSSASTSASSHSSLRLYPGRTEQETAFAVAPTGDGAIDLDCDFAELFNDDECEEETIFEVGEGCDHLADCDCPDKPRALTVPRASFDMLASLLPQHMTRAHLAEYHKGAALMRHQSMLDVPASNYHDLERHFTRCFSLPNNVSFIVQELDRYMTGYPDPYANQQALDLFAINLTERQHNLMGIDSARRVVHQLLLAVQSQAAVAHTCGIWINARDEYGNPCPRLVDTWMPRLLFDRNKCIIMVAPHGTVRLERELAPFHAPCHPPFAPQV